MVDSSTGSPTTFIVKHSEHMGYGDRTFVSVSNLGAEVKLITSQLNRGAKIA